MPRLENLYVHWEEAAVPPDGRWLQRGVDVKRTLLVCSLALVALTIGCTRPLKPGTELRGELTREKRLSDFMDDAQTSFVAAGRPVDEDWACAVYPIRARRDVVIEAESDEFDPVLAAIDKDGALIGVCDDWNGRTDARLVLMDVPRGTRLMVFGVDGRRGEYKLSVSEADSSDYQDFLAATSLSSGSVRSEVVEGKEDDAMNDALSSALQNNTWLSSYAGGRVYPFTVAEHGLYSMDLVSDNTSEFDPILAIVRIDGDRYRYVAYNDDFGMDLNSRVDEILDPGDYAAVVLSYNEQSNGEYTLTLRKYEAEALVPRIVDAPSPGTLYTGEITSGEGLAAGIWPSISRDKPYEVLTSAASPCACFEFTIVPAQAGLYDVDAGSSDVDVFLTLLRRDADSVLYVASNDDFGGTVDSKVSRVLTPGTYVAMVSAYGDSSAGAVDFSYQPSLTPPTPLQPNRPVDSEISLDSPQLVFTFDAIAGSTYTLSATALEPDSGGGLDTFVEATLADGSQLSDDDSGGNLNSRLTIAPTPEQSGRVLVVVRDLYNSGTGRVRVELTQERRSEAQVFGMYD